MKKDLSFYHFCSLFFYIVTGCSSEKNVSSPDEHVKLFFSLDDAAKPYYEVHSRKSVLITPSAMGLIGTDNLNLNKGFSVEQVSFDSKDEQWTQPWGENKTMREHYNEMAVNLKNSYNLFDEQNLNRLYKVKSKT